MDFAVILEQHFVLVVVVACALIGYFIKHASFMKWFNNDDIPIALAIIGAILNLFVSGMSVDSVVYGALMGAASTGFHQALKKLINKTE